MSAPEVIDGEAVEETTALVPSPPAPNLFRTDDPALAAQRMEGVANALCPIIEKRNLYSDIKGKKYVKVEGWQTLGSMLGVTPVTTWTRKINADDVDSGWEARVEARTLAGQTIGAAEAECLRSEERWKDADDYAIRSMAQTRATSKALRSVLGFVVTLAGFEATPAEEVPADGFSNRAPGSDLKVTPNQINKFIKRAQTRHKVSDEVLGLILRQRFEIERLEDLPRNKADALVESFGEPWVADEAPADSDLAPDMDGLDELAGPPVEEIA